MSFSQVFAQKLQNPSARLRQFQTLLQPCGDAGLTRLAARSASLTRHHFGRTMRLFAPLYLSNECINSCTYCGFSRENSIVRVTLEIEGVAGEARHLRQEGFRHLLLVAGEHPKFVSNGYLEKCLRRLAPEVPSLSIEVAPMETPDYQKLVQAGAEGLVVYQETYHRPTYQTLHVAGPKKDFDWRLDCPERGHAAGFRRIGIGALFGLHDWQEEALALATHLEYLQKVCWRSFLSVSLPRIRPAAGGFVPQHPLPDREFLQLICALRVTFPQVGIVVSTREPAELRDAIVPYGVTMMSAGSHTEPGGYTGAGKEDLHKTVRGRIIEDPVEEESATGQFDISDDRSAAEFAHMLRQQGFEPVWKDWDAGILNAETAHAA
jgi:2-iminoacetate synthase